MGMGGERKEGRREGGGRGRKEGGGVSNTVNYIEHSSLVMFGCVPDL